MVADGAAVAAERVALAAQPQLGHRHAWRDHQPAGADQRQREPRPGPKRQRGRAERVDDLQRLVDVVDLDQPVDVRAAEPQLTGRAQQVGERLRSGEGQRRSARLGRLNGAAVPEAQRKRTARKRRLELAA